MKKDTIAAIATSMSEAGIGIIRISGKEALEIGNKIYRSADGSKSLLKVKSHTIHYGFIVDGPEDHNPDKEDGITEGSWKSFIVDEVLVSVMKGPRSYTAEDTVEINCHGGVLVTRKVLETVLKNGARLAEPGEFTKRAFLNGRIDLSKAEAVIDVIHSTNEFALRSSINQLKGYVSELVKDLRAQLLYEIAYIESALDDPEHISLDGYCDSLNEKIQILCERLHKLIVSADNGRIRKEGINTVILGKPNAGKSSLLNILVGEERAIVTDIAGTTRDILQEFVMLDGIGLNIVDTAGIRSTEDRVERIGVEKARKYASEADLILYVADASLPLDESDREIASFIRDKKKIVLLNKADLDAVIGEKELTDLLGDNGLAIVRTSALDCTGMDDFVNTLKEMFFKGQLENDTEAVITSLRHKEALEEAYESLGQVKRSIDNHMPEDFYSIDLMSAYSALGRIIGEEVGEDLVNEIFSRFCMGK